MWVNRATFDELHKRLYETTGVNQALERNYTALMTTLDWLRVRVTQLEMERAQLLFNYTGVKVPTPVIARTDERPDPNISLPHFDDMGDVEAARLGVGWNADGTVNYGKPNA